MTSLLADIVASRGIPAEPVATDALVHLLGRSAAGRQVVTELFLKLCPGAVTGGLSFSGQVIDPGDPARPDIVGTDRVGPRLILEAKFDAELTPLQMGSAYLDRLPADTPGLLAYLVPRDRMPAVWAKLLAGPGGVSPAPATQWGDADQTSLQYPLPSGRYLAAFSWDALFSSLRQSLAAASEVANLADLAQIEGLTAWRTRSGWTPLLPGDLPLRSARQLAALIPAVLFAANTASAGKVTNGSSDGGPGRNVRTELGRSYWVGIWFDHWARYETSPVWAQISVKSPETADQLASVLDVAGLPCRARPTTGDVLVPITVQAGAELGSIKSAIVDQILAISGLLDGLTVHAEGT